jgi:phosphoglycerate kinase
MIAIVRMNLDIDPKEIKYSIRLKRGAASLIELGKKYQKIVILSHRGRPSGRDAKLSLKPVAEALSKQSKKKIVFIDNKDLSKAKDIILSGRKGVYMIENLRFLPGEKSMSPVLARSLAALGEVFINDDFATSHRASASTVGITSFIKSIPGPTLKAEIDALKKAIKRPKHPFVLVVGGAKMSDKLCVIEALLPICDKVLLGGGVGNTVMKASGLDIGISIFDKDLIDEARRLARDDKVVFPADCRVKNDNILDIGPNTSALYSDIIKKAGTVIWAGPLGNFEKKTFAKGSEDIAKSIAQSRAFTLVGGGETTSIIMGLGLEKKISFLSTGGGAMLDFLAGKKMPALEALKIKY